MKILSQIKALVVTTVFCIILLCTVSAAPPEFIRVVSDDNYPPYLFRDDTGKLQGIVVDQWALFEKKTGIKVELSAMDWGTAQKQMLAGKYDVIDMIFENEERLKYYDYTKPYATIDVPIFSLKEIGGITDISSLKGFHVAVKSGDNAENVLIKAGIKNISSYPNYEEIIKAAKRRDAVIFVMDKPPAMYLLNKYGIRGMFNYSEVVDQGQFHRAVLKGNEEMLKTINTGFGSITKAQYKKIDSKWFGNPLISKETIRIYEIAIGTSILVLFFFFGWNRMLRKLNIELEHRVVERTSELASTNVILEETNSILEEEIEEHRITQKEMHKSKNEAEMANLAKSMFLANMSHEIRTPMNGIIGMTDLVLATDLNAEQFEYLSHVKTSTKALLTIINDILDYSKIEAGRLHIDEHAYDIRKVAIEVVKLFEISSLQKNIPINLTIEKDIPDEIMGDSIRVRQILSNLVGNSVKFTLAGNINIHISKNSSGALENAVEGTRERQELIIEVRDTGVGIEKDKFHMLFERFNQLDTTYSKQFQGAGLGLAISKRLAELMDGRIWADENVESGSRFYLALELRIPAHESKPKDNKHLNKYHKSELKWNTIGRKILVVEDDAISRQVISGILEKQNYNITLAKNGLEALEKMGEERFELVFMDIQMPLMDGITATKHIREVEKATGVCTPIVALTAYALTGDSEKFLEAGLDDCLTKPVDSKSILGKVNYWLGNTDSPIER